MLLLGRRGLGCRLMVGLSSTSKTKTVQFVNHMIIGSQMDLSKIDELLKRGLREEAGRAFFLQASVSFVLTFPLYFTIYLRS